MLSSPRYRRETERDGVGRLRNFAMVTHETGCRVEMTPRYRLMSQTFVSILRWGMRRKTNSNSIKKAKAGRVGLSRPQMLFYSLGKSAQTQQNLWPYG